MAQVLEKDPATYSKERDGFLRDLQHFHDTRGTPFKRLPTLGGKEVDLYLLYTLVTAQGGWLKVNSKNAWQDLLQHFHLPSKCVNGSIALKQIYLRYLDRWEKVHFLGEEADRGSDDDEEGRHKKCSARALHMVPLTYNYNQHNVNEANREFNHLSTNLYKATDYDRLALSLISPLPNEQDFAINVCTLLSNDGKHTLKVEKNPRIIDYLLAHAGVFNHGSTRKLFLHNYNTIRKHPIHSFWDEVLESKDILEMIRLAERDEDEQKRKAASKSPKQTEMTTIPATATTTNSTPTPMEVDVNKNERVTSVENDDNTLNDNNHCTRRYFSIDCSDKELFCLERTLGTQDYLGQRVLQIATILRNLSFIDDNVPVLAKNRTFIRFVLLCSSSKWNYLKNLGLDMLGNVAGEFLIKDLSQDKLASVLLTIIARGLSSPDRLWCLSALETLNKLSQNDKNEDILMRSLESTVYEKVCSFLTIHDVMLLIYTLECLYSLSSLGEKSCNLIVGNHGVVDTLVSLVTVEGKSYGPKACIGMKLVETVSGSAPVSSSNTSATTTAATATGVQKIQTTTSTLKANSSPTVAKSISTPIALKGSITSTPVRTITMAPQRLVTVSSSSSTVSTTVSQSMTPQQLIQQQHAHQQAIHENEQFALAWLRASYEPCGNSKVNSQELYKHYINSCTKIGRRGVISPLHFPRCVRSVFGGTVGPNPMKLNNPKEPQFYDGIKVRDQPLVINVPTPTSPIPTTNNTTPTSNRWKSKPKVPTSKALVISTATTTTMTTGCSSSSNQTQNVAKDTTTSPLPIKSPPQLSPALQTEVQQEDGGISPASPILKAQLSAPPKPRETTTTVSVPTVVKTDLKSQALSHPHLSQALLGNSSGNTNSTAVEVSASQQGSNTSLIKSLLANKVNECMTTVSMRTAECQKVVQVAERQQRLLAQKAPVKIESPTVKINGARQLFGEDDVTDSSVSSTTPFTNTMKGKKEPPQPPPPPLAPLTSTAQLRMIRPPSKVENEDSDSLGNNSLTSSTVGVGGVSSTEDGDNSLTSFEGLLNGVPTIDNLLNEDSNSKDSSGEITRNKPLRLADLLEKKIEKTPPIVLNGTFCKDLKLTEKGLELVENHIEKALSRDNKDEPKSVIENDVKKGVKRASTEDAPKEETKKLCLTPSTNTTSNVVNGNAISPVPETTLKEKSESTPSVSNAAAKLFADMAADILEDEDEEQLIQAAQQPSAAPPVEQNPTGSNVGQLVVDNGTGQMLIAAQPRQIIVSQQNASMKTASVAQQPQQTVIVQNSTQQRPQMVLQQTSGGQLLLSQGLQGQVQFVTSNQSGQYVLQTGNTPGTYVVAQPQTAMVHGQPQTVLVAQTAQQHATGAKTIIILQQQSTSTNAAHQKVVVTPQGQQVVVAQVPRPVIHTSVGNLVQTQTVIKANPVMSTVSATVATATTTTAAPTASSTNNQVKQEEKPVIRVKVIRDISHPYICEWGDCTVTTKFKSANEVFMHACEAHCPKNSTEDVVCQWERCDNLKRKRFSLMTHLQDKHCNTEAMKQAVPKRKNPPPTVTVVKSETTTVVAANSSSSSSSQHPGYAPDAALHAIKRHALEFVNPKELQDDNEGPVTKSIRLTASLILRNLVIYSGNCRRYLKHYESHLANVALSNVESSRTVAQILYDLNESSNHR